ncbi:MAG TPA: zinc-dependent metalloprotease [Longimicrobiaceae bacterium]|nr:zinc-dependent metalloprotease [Longimicrobiaceae bacterium]
MTRNRTPRPLVAAALAVLSACAPSSRPSSSPTPSQPPSAERPPSGAPATQQGFAQRTAGLQRQDGYFPFYWDARNGKLLLEVGRVGEDFLYLNSLATGIGSNALGLDRGTLGDGAVVRFERHGPKLLLVQQNTGFRAVSARSEAEVRSVQESFPTSVRGAFPIQAEEGGRFLIDATDFFLQDAFGVAGQIRRANQGEFRLDRDRSTVYLPRTRAFPKNTEVEVLLTFASDNPGPEIARHTPDGRSLSLRQHHSFVELPPPGYRPRAFDPRVGVNALTFYDFSQPFSGRFQQRWISRWRLEKKDPGAAMSEPVKPIVYYLDPGIPEPYRTAFREGALWWNRVFEAAGFINAFQVQDLPEGADPMDARYSVIQWVHRTDPGFSIGPSFRDPRTGEIIKAAVRMDTYRSLTDFNIFAGTVPSMEPVGDWVARLDPSGDAEAFTMMRRRQHVAHEIGHTLGLAHNFIASSYGRASVMDYPGPLIRLRDGRIDLSEAYRAGPGAYDTLAIRYAYTQFATPEAEARGLREIVREGLRRGIRFMADRDADEVGGMMAEVTRWANGSDRLAELERTSEVRRFLLDRFGAAAIRPGEPMHLLNERLVPVFLHHRYAIEAAIKTVGGLEYTYALSGDEQAPAAIVDPADQRRALAMLVRAIQPEGLAIPERVAALIPPPPFGYGTNAWSFASSTGSAFDPLGAAQMLSSMVVDGLLHRERAARLVSFHARNPAAPSLDEMMGRLVEGTWGRPTPTSPREAALRRVAQRVVVDRLIALASERQAAPQVRASAEYQLARLAERLSGRRSGDTAQRAHEELAVRDIRRFLERRANPTEPSQPLPIPPGTPIGSGG